jgi:hypothetical protein
MADERAGTRDFNARKTLSWTELLRTFLIALDPFKLVVAAIGILATAIGWWLISAVFFAAWGDPPKSPGETTPQAQADYEAELGRYRFMESVAGPGGKFRAMPWFEDRGRNPIVVARILVAGGEPNRVSKLLHYFASQVPVLAEPLEKFLSPIAFLFESNANFGVRLYLFFLIIWFLLVWAFFGGVITRMAIVQMAGKEGGGLRDAVRFVKARYLSYFSSPIVPILLIFAVVLGCILFGLFALIPGFGDIVVSGLLWWIPIGAGFVMALLIVGLVGYPLMYTTLSAEGSDTFDALSRSYNYVYESPWHYIWYGFVSVVYGVVVVCFVVFMSSLMVYLGKWGVGQAPFSKQWNRSPEYLFVYAPTSFGWRELMLQDSPAAITPNLSYGPGDRLQYIPVNSDASSKYMAEFTWYNQAGAGMVGFWVTLFFMLMLGFSYSYFWTASSMIYLLMRKKVDEVEVDEIYTEEEDFEKPAPSPKLSTPPATGATIPVDAPTLRVQSAPPPPPAPESNAPPAPPTDQPPPAASS